MGTQEEEREWVDVANDLLSKCHVNLRLRKLADCDASVFIALYEKILEEKVPDFIEAPRSQEDDVHNVQSVIDSLSLDYLQISLSHITGENVVRGNRESIKNLLEIFEGLLEYLKEEISDESQNGDELIDSLSGDVPMETKDPRSSSLTEDKEAKLERRPSSSSGESSVHSSKHSLHSWNAEGTGSNREVLGLGVSARTFTARTEASTSGPLDVGPLSQPQLSAIDLQPPHQSSTTQRPHSELQPSSKTSGAEEHPGAGEGIAAVTTETSAPPAETVVTNGLQSPGGSNRAESEKSASSWRRSRMAMEAEALEPTNGGARRVLFRTQPDVLFLTLQDEIAPATPSPLDTEEGEEEEQDAETMSFGQRQPHRGVSHRDRKGLRRGLGDQSVEESLSYRRRRNKQAEEELHHISEKLSHRLEELDQMLKRVLVESGESAVAREEDKQSHHSDSVMECRRTPRPHTVSEMPVADSPHRTRSLSPSPPRVRHSLQLEEESAEALIPADGQQTDVSASDRSRREELHKRSSRRKHSKHLLNKAYAGELARLEVKKQEELNEERLRAQEAERQYREAILGDVSQATRPSAARAKVQHWSQPRQYEASRRTPSMKVGENELLPLLLDELPHLYVSPHALERMWQQQMQQVDRLHAVSLPQRRGKLSRELEEAQRKHDLLVEIVRKDRDHKRRLKDFKERIQQQKSTQNRLREQRQQIAQARKYHNNYHVQHRARLMRARTKEERMFRQLFEEGLELQKERLREQRAQARTQRLEHQRRHDDQIASMENYYKDQFSLLAEKLAEEREEVQLRKKAQEKALLKMKRELRSRMEREINELQKIIIQNDEDDFFQGAEVQRLRNRMQMASFQFNTSYLH